MAWLLALLRALPELLSAFGKLAQVVRDRRAARQRADKDTRNDAAIAEAQKGLDRPKP